MPSPEHEALMLAVDALRVQVELTKPVEPGEIERELEAEMEKRHRYDRRFP